MILLRDTDTETDSGQGRPWSGASLLISLNTMVRTHQSQPEHPALSTSQHEDILALPGPRPPDEQCMDELL